MFTRIRMKRLLRNGVDPTEVSIVKWKDNIYSFSENASPRTCALCKTYGPSCQKCPLKLIGEKCDDTNSIYQNYSRYSTSRNARKMITALEKARLYELLLKHGMPSNLIFKQVIKKKKGRPKKKEKL